jgi:TolB-like protein/DNA-binding winged helix-turn-helix (wHTH) protein/Tfp pilus assembly protein PilF
LEGDFKVGEWLVQPRLNTISANNVSKRIEPKLMEVLVYLAKRPDQVVSKDDLLQDVWLGAFVTEQVLKVSISELRKALEDSAREPRYIRTISKKGYQLIAPLSIGEESSINENRVSTILDQNMEEKDVTPGSGFRARRFWVLMAGVFTILIVIAVVVLNSGGLKIEKRNGNSLPVIRAIAVLPFDNLSGDLAQDYFVDGITEALIADLAKIGSLRVISRTSVMRYKGLHKSASEIARELNVDCLIEGSLLRSGDKVIISLKLVDGSNDRLVWARSYEQNFKDISSLQSALALEITKQIKDPNVQNLQLPSFSTNTIDPEAYEAYLKGRFFWNKRNNEGLLKSIGYFRQAIDKEPNFALAYAGLANAYTVMGFYGSITPRDAYSKAKEAAKRALELDNSLAETHTAVAGIKHKFDLDWQGAEKEFQIAIDLNPNYSTAHEWYAIFLQSRGQFDEALSEIDRALERDPLSLTIRADRGWILYTARRYDEAINELRQIQEMDSTFPVSYFLVLAYAKKGMYEEAIAELERIMKLSGRTPIYVSMLGYTHALAGRRAIALDLLKELEERRKRDEVRPYELALVYVGLNEKDQAFKWLEQIYREGSSWQPFIKVEPELDNLRSDPRFNDLLRRIGLSSETANRAS